MSRGSKKDAGWSRESHCEKEKPAVRDMLTAGVAGAEGLGLACRLGRCF